jgi:hypothetical protein
MTDGSHHVLPLPLPRAFYYLNVFGHYAFQSHSANEHLHYYKFAQKKRTFALLKWITALRWSKRVQTQNELMWGIVVRLNRL